MSEAVTGCQWAVQEVDQCNRFVAQAFTALRITDFRLLKAK